ncbi:MAG: hypothetical protein ACI9J2_001522 [Saprospiraceae bacterium]|jgi:hypothetical protein
MALEGTPLASFFQNVKEHLYPDFGMNLLTECRKVR